MENYNDSSEDYNDQLENYNDQLGDYNDQSGEDLGKKIVGAIIYFFSMLGFILFVCPFAFWKGAAIRLATAYENKSLKTFVQTSRWPFFSFLKKIFFDFLIDGMIFMCYFMGALTALYLLFTEWNKSGFSNGFSAFIGTLISAYYLPLVFSWCRDLFVLLLLPFQKFLSWVSKPAQQLDLDFHNHSK